MSRPGEAGEFLCTPGCSVYEHGHGSGAGSTAGNDGGTGEADQDVSIGGIKGKLGRFADNIDNGVPHAERMLSWLDGLQVDLMQRMGGSSLPEVHELRQLIGNGQSAGEQYRNVVQQIASTARSLAGKL